MRLDPTIPADVEKALELYYNTLEPSFTFESNFIPTFKRGHDAPRINTSELAPGLGAGRRICWMEDRIGNNSSKNVIFRNSKSTPISAEVVLEETTLYGSYNTSVSDFNFLELTGVNKGDVEVGAPSSLSGVVLLTGYDGTEREIPFTLSSSSDNEKIHRLDISIHDALNGKRDFGTIKVRHNGAPGQLRARLSQYDITSAADQPLNFSLVGQEQLKRGLGE